MSWWVSGALVLSAAVTAVGSYSSAQASKKAADRNADIMEQNAIAEQNKSNYDAARHRESIQKLLSAQRALWGKSGVDMEGTPLLTLEDTAGQGELDALAIRYGGDIAAARQRSGASLSRMEGKNAQTAGYFTAGSSLLSGAASAGGYATKNRAGMTSTTVVKE